VTVEHSEDTGVAARRRARPFGRLKALMPTGIYARGALILLVPIVTIQLVMSLAFIQRHFEAVTRQMTAGLVPGLQYLLAEVEAAPDAAAAAAAARALAAPLALRAELPSPSDGMLPVQDARDPWDLSGREVIAGLREWLPGVVAVDLVGERRMVLVHVDTRHGPVLIGLERFRVSASNPHQLLVVVLATAVLMTVIAFLFLRNQLRPIRRLAVAAEAFGRGEAVPLRVSGADEVRAAAGAFLHMRDRIARQQAQRALMLSGVSHDLRTPLTRLRLGLAMLDDRAEADALGRDVDEMERLLDAFLAYARGDADLATAPCDGAALAAERVERARSAGGAVTLADGAITDGAPLALDAGLFTRAVDNLIGNALRYAGRARVGIHRDAGALQITVEDDGPGIPADRRAEAVQPFVRLDAARNQNLGGGVGLGLAIAAQAAARHGGTLALDDSPDLGGLRATLTFPTGRG